MVKLLTTNHKLKKCLKYGYLALGLQLLPHTLAGQKKTLCPKSTVGCRESCLVYSGRGSAPQTHLARQRRTEFYLGNPAGFLAQLHHEIDLAFLRTPFDLAIRLNVFSDIDWVKLYPGIFAMHPSTQFYDYTKVMQRMFRSRHEQPSNYHLTFSRSEKNWLECVAVLEAGMNVTVVVENEQLKRHYLKYGYRDWDCVDGDKHDLIFLHPQPRVILLTAKGPGKKDRTKFVVREAM